MDIVSDLESMLRRKLTEGIAELEDEIAKLRKALGYLGSGSTSSQSETPAASPKPRRRKRAARGQRKEQLLAAVKDQPGVTVAQAAKKIGVSPPNALYALANRLVKEGLIVKDGAGYKLKADEPETPKAPPAKSTTKRRKGSAKKGGKKPRRKPGS